MEYDVVIGLEVHVQLNTNTKIFCSCSTKFGSPPNSQTCPVCQGHPGVLPVLNENALDIAIKAGLALGCDITKTTRFDRKHYFYPDLPKAYQISQYDHPLCTKGSVSIKVINPDGSSYDKDIGITRIHMEEDAGKLIHPENGLPVSYVDLNRAGTPLIEIVSEPEISSAEEAYQYLNELKKVLLYIEASDCNMEEGSLRCDANISLKPSGQKEFGTRAEIKNLNSFRNVRAALEYEIKRQKKLLDKGEKVIQETRLYDAVKLETRSMRGKEEAHDYRYFPDPDLSPQIIRDEKIEEIRKHIPELPKQKRERLKSDYALPDHDIIVLTETRELAEYYERAVKAYPKEPKKISNWIMTEVNAILNETLGSISDFKVAAEHIGEIYKLMDEGTISGKIAKQIWPDMVESGKSPSAIIEEKGLKQMSGEDEIAKVVKGVMEANSKAVEEYRGGKTKSFGFLVGQCMKATKGQANPQVVNEVLKKLLDE